MESKFFLKSTTIQGAILAILGLAASWYGVTPPLEEARGLISAIISVYDRGIEAIGILMIIIGRFKANQPLTVKVTK